MATEPEPKVYARVEIMGHTRRAGAIREVAIAGVQMLEIEHPTALGHDGAPLTVCYSGAAIFSIARCSLDEATTANRWSWPDPAATVPELGPAGEHVDDDDFDDLDDAPCPDRADHPAHIYEDTDGLWQCPGQPMPNDGTDF